MSDILSFHKGAESRRSSAFDRTLPSWPASFRTRMIADLLGFAEMAVVVIASVVAKYIYIVLFLEDARGTEPYLLGGIVCAVCFRQLLRARGLTHIVSLRQGSRQWGAVVGSLSVAFLAVIATAYLFKVSADFSRGWLVTWYVLACAWVMIGRIAMRHFLLSLARTGEFKRRIAILSFGGSEQNLLQAIKRQAGMRLVGNFLIDPSSIVEYGNNPTITVSPFAQLIEVGKLQAFDELIIRVPQLTSEQLSTILLEVSVLPVDVWLSTSDDVLDLPVYGFGRIGGINLLQVRQKPFDGWGLVAKQVIDYMLASIGLLVVLPIFMMIAMAIKLDAPGPVFFRQRRHGFNEREFFVFKFRTMKVMDDGDVVQQACKNDSRVTRTGRFLRRTSLDELPQLINVLRGEMSLVGPRPHALAHNSLYCKRIRSYANRHQVKPGITGLAQVNGLRGETDTQDKMKRRVDMDLYYIENWSIWLDLKILALTPIFGFLNRNAV